MRHRASDMRSRIVFGTAGEGLANGGANARPSGRAWTVSLAVALVSVVARIPALGAWWCLDDWGQLARAAGRLESPVGLPARWLSQQAWWSLTWPLFGLNAAAHAWLRILLHAVAAVMVVRIARRAGLQPLAQLTAGLLFAATPVAFTPLYWASGIQELLGGVLALLAVERWLANGRGWAPVAGLAAIGAILAKEGALGLPVFFAIILVARRQRAGADAGLRWLIVVGLAAVAVVEAALVMRHFATGPRDPYALGGPLVMLGNLGKFGWWLPTPGPVFTAQVTWTRAGFGIALLLGWGAYGAAAWRQGKRLPLAAWTCALLSLTPALPLVNQARPYMAYLAAAAGSLTLASLLPVRWRPGVPAMAALIVAATLWGQFTMRGRLSKLEADGQAADPVVRASRTARAAAKDILALLPSGAKPSSLDLFIFQPHLKTTDGKSGEAIIETPQYAALGGALGVKLLLGGSGSARWTASLLDASSDAFVLCEKGRGFQAWGATYDALLYAAQLHIIAGNYPIAAALLTRADELDPTRELRLPERDILGIPGDALRIKAIAFERWLESMVTSDQMPSDEFRRLRRFVGTW